jgi:hypothetical protein
MPRSQQEPKSRWCTRRSEWDGSSSGGRDSSPSARWGQCSTASSLGDLDETQWEIGLSGKPTDPWQFQVLVPMYDIKTGEMYIFGTTSITGRRECDKLISACARMQKSEPDFYPVVKLDVSGFQHRDSRIGWVRTPCFTRIGKAPKSDTSAAQTSLADSMSDALSF